MLVLPNTVGLYGCRNTTATIASTSDSSKFVVGTVSCVCFSLGIKLLPACGIWHVDISAPRSCLPGYDPPGEVHQNLGQASLHTYVVLWYVPALTSRRCPSFPGPWKMLAGYRTAHRLTTIFRSFPSSPLLLNPIFLLLSLGWTTCQSNASGASTGTPQIGRDTYARARTHTEREAYDHRPHHAATGNPRCYPCRQLVRE